MIQIKHDQTRTVYYWSISVNGYGIGKLRYDLVQMENLTNLALLLQKSKIRDIWLGCSPGSYDAAIRDFLDKK